ncbi:MAG: PAS domain S-box protein [Acidobacteriia bacterium]|nr:PAS domain S-box protein [Terriglobia bacterium]
MSKPLFDPEGSGKMPHPLKSLAETLLSPSLLEAIPDAIVAVNEEGIVVQVNSQTQDLFGYTRDELIGQKIEMLVPERQRLQHHHHREGFAERPRIRRMGAGLDLYGRRRDGSEFPVEISLSPVAIGDGLLVLSAIRDMSDRKRIEEELRRAHEDLERRKDRQLWDYQSRLALAVDSSQDAIIGKNLDGIITHWNKGAEHIYGYTAEEAIGKSISILASRDRADESPKILEMIRRGERVEYFESVRVTKDGRYLNVSISVSPVRDAEGAIVGAFTIARNITAQKRAEDQLRQAQKMESVGRLAGGVAHDFNNLLGIITASGELLRGFVERNPEPLQYIDNIRKAAERGASLTRQLLAFSRKQLVQPRVLDLNEQLKEVSKLLRPLMGDDVQVVLSCRSASAIVEADPGQLDQIVLNLAVNARDAMPRGGKLILETAVMEFDQAFAEQHPPMTAGRSVMLAISDNGCGMDEATVSQIFEPFFTTKETGKGTGLGLATVYGIVKQSGGHILVYSEPGRGTTFKIYLPCADHKLGLATGLEAETLPPRAGGRTVLVVEDEEVMRALTRHMLEEHGYHVVEAGDGKSALERLGAEHTSVDVTLTDVVMRGMSGPELVLRLIESHPAMRVVYMSGYTGELLADHGGLTPGVNLLEKPFTRAGLLKTIHHALG